MEKKDGTLAAIGRWEAARRHLVPGDDELWCANAFTSMTRIAAFYLLSDEHTRHGQMTGEGRSGRHGQRPAKTVA
jgi:uncharacterized protein YhbP (UPF0306 family)